MKPLNCKNYGSIPHLLSSKLGEGDKHIHIGQDNIITKKTRDRYDTIIITEKYDGSNVGVCKKNNKIHAITRSGYLATTSKYIQHHYFNEYVIRHYKLFDSILDEGDRICGEWLLSRHSLKYEILNKNPFVAFDLFKNNKRISTYDFYVICSKNGIQLPRLLYYGNKSIKIESVLTELKPLEICNIKTQNPEGFIVRVERNGIFDFMAKYVRHDFEAGKYMDEEIYNIDPKIII